MVTNSEVTVATNRISKMWQKLKTCCNSIKQYCFFQMKKHNFQFYYEVIGAYFIPNIHDTDENTAPFLMQAWL